MATMTDEQLLDEVRAMRRDLAEIRRFVERLIEREETLEEEEDGDDA